MRVKLALAKNCDAMAHHTLLVIVVGLSTVSYITGGCLNCFNTCNEDGLCDDYGCQAGYHGDNCSLPCPTNCRDGVFKKPACARNTSSCLSGCRGGFFSERCDQQCPSTCVNKVCNQMDGYCRLGCKEHWHGPSCTAKCNTTCFKSTCDRNGLCESCETGYWGLFCENNCSQHCLNNTCAMSQDGSFECSHGCQKGWEGASCEEPSLEDMGHSNTRRKRDSSDCYVNEVDGKCPCCRRNTGERCEINCPKCKARYSGSNCIPFCEQGYYNGINGLCSKTCGKNCAPGGDNKTSCNPTDGGCSSCRSGYRGHMCGFTCSDYCLNKTCSIHSAYCLNCSNVTFGDHCRPCSEFCIDKFCHRWNGTCMTGCTLGKYGVKCSHDCPTNCYKSHCSLSIYGNVFCTGCKDGFTGSSCEERCPVNCTTCRQVDGECIAEKLKPWKITVAVIGGVVAVAVTVAVAVLIWKRKHHIPCIKSYPDTSSSHQDVRAEDISVESASDTQQDASTRPLEPEVVPLMTKKEDSGDPDTSSSLRGVRAENISDPDTSSSLRGVRAENISGLPDDTLKYISSKLMGYGQDTKVNFFSHIGYHAENVPNDCTEELCHDLLKKSVPLKTASEMDALKKLLHASQLANMDDIFEYIYNKIKDTGDKSLPEVYDEKYRRLQKERKERERSGCIEK